MTNEELKTAFKRDDTVTYQDRPYKINRIYYYRRDGKIEVGAELFNGFNSLVCCNGKEVRNEQ